MSYCDYLRLRGAIPDQTDSLMVVDRSDGYLGILPLHQLLIRPAGGDGQEVMLKDFRTDPCPLAGRRSG
ncbi:MAG: hypothetical protein R3F37_13065 [Candidatus Competibacteraceae bacterium]